MKRIGLVILIVLLFQAVACADKYYYKRFKEDTGVFVDASLFVISQTEEGMTRYVWDNRNNQYWEITEYTYDQGGMCVIYHRTNDAENTKYSVVNDGAQLIISGILNGTEVEKVISYKKYPFYANPKIDLMDLVRTSKKTVQFWTLRRDTLEAYKMRAYNKGIDTIVRKKHLEHAYLVEWGPSLGMFTKYFGRKYWFRESDQLFLKQTGSNKYVRDLVKKID